MFDTFSAADARRWLTALRPYTAHLVLRPFVDAYHVVADRLAEWEADEVFDEKRFLDECLRVGKQWVLQRRLASEESVSLELFKPALRLAGHRGLLDSTTPELSKLRREFADEITSTVRRINEIASLARSAGAHPDRGEIPSGEFARTLAEQLSIPVDQDLLRGLLRGRFVGAFDEFAVLELRAGSDQRDQVRRVHGAPA